jgi:8-oxo-dGTP diphosphatase
VSLNERALPTRPGLVLLIFRGKYFSIILPFYDLWNRITRKKAVIALKEEQDDDKMTTYVAVVGVVVKQMDNEGQILLLKRNAKRRTSPNKWQTPSGFIKEGESAEEAVLREVKEETSLECTIKKSGSVFEVADEWARWIIVPFLISVKSDNKAVVIDTKEHSEFKWVNVDEVSNFECVKGINEDLEALGLK